MQMCPLYPLLRGSKKPADAAGSTARRALAVSITVLGWTGWRALHNLLSAIPDSNDDFGLF